MALTLFALGKEIPNCSHLAVSLSHVSPLFTKKGFILIHVFEIGTGGTPPA